jgi:hypothetical protein
MENKRPPHPHPPQESQLQDPQNFITQMTEDLQNFHRLKALWPCSYQELPRSISFSQSCLTLELYQWSINEKGITYIAATGSTHGRDEVGPHLDCVTNRRPARALPDIDATMKHANIIPANMQKTCQSNQPNLVETGGVFLHLLYMQPHLRTSIH